MHGSVVYHSAVQRGGVHGSVLQCSAVQQVTWAMVVYYSAAGDLCQTEVVGPVAQGAGDEG